MDFFSVRYAARGLIRAPIFALTVVLTLAVVISANSAMFSIIDRVLLRPLPFPKADRLVYLSHAERTSFLPRDIPPGRLLDWSERNVSFEAISAYYTEDVTDTTTDQPKNLRRATMGPGFLDAWGFEPALGRSFVSEEHSVGGPASVLVSNDYWREYLHADLNAIGATLVVEGRPATVVGVMPADLEFVDSDVDLWFPLLINAPFVTQRQTGWFGGIVGRLRPGVSRSQAELDLESVQSQLADEYPETDSDLAISAIPFRNLVVGPFSSSLWLLFGAVLMLLLIACTNIVAVLLARSTQRERDVAIRFSLGASRRRIATHILAETAWLVLAGTVGGLILASAAIGRLQSYTSDLPTFGRLELDARVLAYTLLSAVLVVLLCGLFPAVRSAKSLTSLSHTGRTELPSRQTVNWALVGVQIALSVTLLTSAGLLLRSFDALSRVDPGFQADQVLTFRISGNFNETSDFPAILQRINRTIDELDALPGVESVGTSFSLPGVSGSSESQFAFVDWTPLDDAPIIAQSRTVSPTYFQALQIPLLSGELCGRASDPFGPREVMVNRAFAERYFGSSSVIGRQLTGQQPARVVGIVGNARETGMHFEPPPSLYTCYSAPNPFPWFLVRTSGEPTTLVETVRARIAELEPLRSVYDFAPLGRRIGDVYAQDRLRTVLLTLFSLASLLLACLGVYGTLNYVVSLRRRDVGLRVALGALRNMIVTHYLAKALKVVGVGCLIGLGLSVAFSRMLSSMLYGVSPSDPITLGTAIGIVVIVAAIGAVVPLMRASRIDPIVALRED